mmetsp:Transcript_9864/g.13389  ORF Transcript_9864/g.13389 Transcript_9864/m.13389 type:complete len:134 (+) Transcript_9864:45-446(+)
MQSNADVVNGEENRRTITKLDPVILPFSDSSLSDFTIGESIGSGTFAHVNACYHSISKEKFAIKSMRKIDVIRMRQVQHVLNEKSILSRVNHPNIIRAYGSFNDNVNIYLMVEYVPGGELFVRLRDAGRFSEN